jgi:hypothetical protein
MHPPSEKGKIIQIVIEAAAGKIFSSFHDCDNVDRCMSFMKHTTDRDDKSNYKLNSFFYQEKYIKMNFAVGSTLLLKLY